MLLSFPGCRPGLGGRNCVLGQFVSSVGQYTRLGGRKDLFAIALRSPRIHDVSVINRVNRQLACVYHFGLEALYIEPVSPWQNVYDESFNNRLRDDFLEMNLDFYPNYRPTSQPPFTICYANEYFSSGYLHGVQVCSSCPPC